MSIYTNRDPKKAQTAMRDNKSLAAPLTLGTASRTGFETNGPAPLTVRSRNAPPRSTSGGGGVTGVAGGAPAWDPSGGQPNMPAPNTPMGNQAANMAFATLGSQHTTQPRGADIPATRDPGAFTIGSNQRTAPPNVGDLTDYYGNTNATDRNAGDLEGAQGRIPGQTEMTVDDEYASNFDNNDDTYTDPGGDGSVYDPSLGEEYGMDPWMAQLWSQYMQRGQDPSQAQQALYDTVQAQLGDTTANNAAMAGAYGGGVSGALTNQNAQAGRQAALDIAMGQFDIGQQARDAQRTDLATTQSALHEQQRINNEQTAFDIQEEILRGAMNDTGDGAQGALLAEVVGTLFGDQLGENTDAVLQMIASGQWDDQLASWVQSQTGIDLGSIMPWNNNGG